MALIENICPKCNGTLTKTDSGYECKFCASSFEEKNIIDAEVILKKLEEREQELYCNAKFNLWKEAHEEYLSSKNIEKWCDEIKKYSQDDFLANYYSLCINNEIEKLIKLILEIDSENIYADEVVKFTIKTMDNIRLAQPVKSIIEELKNKGKFTAQEYLSYMSEIDKVIDKIDNGVFDIDLPRDVFVAYSSKDIKKVNEVVDFLEDNGYTCFTAIRNLRHGLGAKENYQENLFKAMRNSKCMVFISSENSRDNSCDAMKIEIPFYKTLEKKGRVEYLVEEYGKNTKEVSKRKLIDFFQNLEFCRTLVDLALRVDKARSASYINNEEDRFKAQIDEQLKRLFEESKAKEAEEKRLAEEKAKKEAEEKRLVEEKAKKEAEKKRLAEEKAKKENEEDRFKAQFDELKRLFEESKDKEAEEKRLAEEKAKKEAEKKRLAEEKAKKEAEKKRLAEEKAKKEAEKNAKLLVIEDGKLVKYKGNGGNVVIPNSVTSIGDSAFKDCSSLTSIEIPNGVTSIGYRAFSSCSSLKSIVIPNSVTSIGSDAFKDCSSLKSIVIPNSVTSIGSDAFKGCRSLTSIEIPNSVTSIGQEAFEGCRSLTSIEIPNSVTSIEYAAFSGCSSLTSIEISNSVTIIGASAFAYCSSLKSIVIPDSVTIIGADAFKNCSSLTSIVIPNSVTSIWEWAFFGCSSLTNIEIPNSVTRMGREVFYGCSKDLVITVHYKGLFRPYGWKIGWNGRAKVQKGQ